MTAPIPTINSDKTNTENLPKRKRKIDIAEALKLRIVNQWSYSMLAERYNCTKSSVHGALKRFVNIIGSPSLTDAYEDNKANVLGSLQLKTLEYLADDKTLKKASANNLAYLFTQLHNAQRLEQGRSTSNIGISVESHLTKALEQASSTDDVV